MAFRAFIQSDPQPLSDSRHFRRYLLLMGSFRTFGGGSRPHSPSGPYPRSIFLTSGPLLSCENRLPSQASADLSVLFPLWRVPYLCQFHPTQAATTLLAFRPLRVFFFDCPACLRMRTLLRFLPLQGFFCNRRWLPLQVTSPPRVFAF